MRIDLTNVGNGHELSDYDMMHLRGSHLYSSLVKSNFDMNSNFNYLVISMLIYNAIEQHPNFKAQPVGKIDDLCYVGFFGSFECYVDLHLPPRTIIMQYDKQVYRDNKIDSILNGVDIINKVKILVDGL